MDWPQRKLGHFGRVERMKLNILEKTVRAAVGIGTNLGDREALMAAAGAGIRGLPHCHGFRFSPIYQTAAVDCPDPRPFLNAVVAFDTRLDAEQLLDCLQALEHTHGRTRPYPNAPRYLDLDLLLYGDEVRQSRRLTLPHPRMGERLFVLTPLAQVWDETPLPGWNCSVSGLEARRRAGGFNGDVISMSRFQWGVNSLIDTFPMEIAATEL